MVAQILKVGSPKVEAHLQCKAEILSISES